MRPVEIEILRNQQLKGRRFLRRMVRYLVFIFGIALFHVWTRVDVVETGYQIRTLRDRHEQLLGEHHSLKLEIATLRAHSRLKKIAKDLGLNPPPENHVTFMTSRVP